MTKLFRAAKRALNLYGGGSRDYIWYLYHNI